MKDVVMHDLQASVQDNTAFTALQDYYHLTSTFLSFLQNTPPTRIVSPNVQNYIFYQYPEDINFKITRPLNHNLFIEAPETFKQSCEQFFTFLGDLKRQKSGIVSDAAYQSFIADNQISKVVYTMQQAIGCIGDAFENANQSRKRIGQLFESLIKLIIKEIGLECEPRRVLLPIIGFEGYTMSYGLSVRF